MSEYIPSPSTWVAEQVELYEGSGGTEGVTLRDTGLPVIIVTNRGRKSGAIRKTPLMRAVDGERYILIASQGGAPKHPVWYSNLKADRSPRHAGAGSDRSQRAAAAVGYCGSRLSSLSDLPGEDRAAHSGLCG
jgi:deazaflavin-dependent oxidoreductase (nitroreductase family)